MRAWWKSFKVEARREIEAIAVLLLVIFALGYKWFVDFRYGKLDSDHS